MEYRETRFSLNSSATPSSKRTNFNNSNYVSLSTNSTNVSYVPYYDTYPENLTISLEVFQSLGIERLRILKTIEQVLARLNTTLSTAPTNKKDEIEKLIRKELKDKLNYLKVLNLYKLSYFSTCFFFFSSLFFHHFLVHQPMIYKMILYLIISFV